MAENVKLPTNKIRAEMCTELRSLFKADDAGAPYEAAQINAQCICE